MTDKNFSEPPRQNVAALGSQFVQLWQTMAKESAGIAHAKRTLFLAYIAEGFTEAQALDLVKTA